MDFLWDTPVILHYLRNSGTYEELNEKYGFFAPGNYTTFSFVSLGEILSLTLQFNWGKSKIQLMEAYLANIPVMSIERREIVEAYAEIDTFSLSKHPYKPLPAGNTARKMGKNDLWIAATCHVAGDTFAW